MSQKKQKAPPAWMEVVRKYNTPDHRKSVWQLINSVLPYGILWYLMYLSLQTSYWITLGLAIPAAGFLVRIFIIFHDCGHGSFFRSSRANRIVGTILGSLAFTPYDYWHNEHAIHHRTVGNLDKRGKGDVWTLTVDEYRELPPGKKLVYRLYRHPVILFGLAPVLLFVVWFRIPRKTMTPGARRSVHVTNLFLVTMAAGLSLLMGWRSYLLIQLPVIYIASTAGVWLFYVQHQFEGVIWTRKEAWDYRIMALKGSSYLKLPRILQWFSGNIGFHHIHHLSPRIPNYKLENCHRENAMFHQVSPLTFIPGVRTMGLRLWDERSKRLIGFRPLRKNRDPQVG